MTEFSELEFGFGIYFCFIDYAKAFDCVKLVGFESIGGFEILGG